MIRSAQGRGRGVSWIVLPCPRPTPPAGPLGQPRDGIGAAPHRSPQTPSSNPPARQRRPGAQCHAGDAFEKRPCGFTPDGGTLLYEAAGNEAERGVWGLSIHEKAAPRRRIAGTLSEPRLSPDGRFLVYQSGEFGSFEIFVQRFHDRGRRVQVSVGGGRTPRWSEDGREIFYLRGERFFAVPLVTAGNEPETGPPQRLFERADVEGYEIAPDGEGFIAVERLPDSGIVRQLQLVTGWFTELERLAPGK
jgi:hypothetical protein